MSEAKNYDTKLKSYREAVEQFHRSSSIQRSKSVSGIEIVTNEINKLNGEYQALLEKILDLLKQLQDDEAKLREFVSDHYFILLFSTKNLSNCLQIVIIFQNFYKFSLTLPPPLPLLPPF